MIENASAGGSLIVVHAQYTEGTLWLWAESGAMLLSSTAGESGSSHPIALDASTLAKRLDDVLGPAEQEPRWRLGRVPVSLPSSGGRVLPSRTLVNALGRDPDADGAPDALKTTEAEGLAVAPENSGPVLDWLAEHASGDEGEARGLLIGPGTDYFAVAARLADHVLARQRFVPMLRQDGTGEITGAWEPWFADAVTTERVGALVRAMPPIARASSDAFEHDPWRITVGFVSSVVDAKCRRALIDEEMFDTVAERDTQTDGQVAWMHGLLGDSTGVPSMPATRNELSRSVRKWIGQLEDKGRSSEWRLLLRMNEPLSEGLAEDIDEPGDDLLWSVSFHLQSQEVPELVIDAADVWVVTKESITVEGLRLDKPHELLLGELGRASRIYKKLESVLDDSEPIELNLQTKDAYEFLREIRPLLEEQGFGMESPAWWDSPTGRLGAKLKIESDPLEQLVDSGPASGGSVGARVGLSALVGYHWEIAIGDTTLTLHEFEQLANKQSPLVRIGGKWVEIRPEDVASAIDFIRENPGGEMKLAEAMRLAYASDPKQVGVPILGLEATGWVATILGGGVNSGDEPKTTEGAAGERIPTIETPKGFHGTLRTYQQRGLSWMVFLEQFGFGGCLADDMGLGKTVQLLALLMHEREAARAIAEETGEPVERVKPTLLIVPMSVVGNWLHESKRFTPELRVLLHHGLERLQGDELFAEAMSSDLIVTTYALANRDQEALDQIQWGRIVVDEAQYIKNPSAKQSVAVRGLRAEKRIALTGTPVENRLSELWSIMDFLNPGYLGQSGNFRKKFSVPIERYRDVQKSQQLRGLVRPFILRRVKTDPTVVADLPEKLESREFTHLTSEQAALYENTVKRMLSEVEASEGIHRRGLVLAALIKLKQICNHPAQALKDHDFASGAAPDPSRSGKSIRMMEMVEELLSEGERALVFTQFRQMGHLLASMIRQETGRDVLFLHGGTPQGQRVKMVEQFQDQSTDKPILILSLKAGGVGLNLTAATHVFHYDRWWNPAVENQATDRAYRIGQTRTVHVHKFVVRGTLEERIDEMIESKTELAERIIGAGERWLTELDTDQLRDLLALRADAIGDEV